jgi:hypothetical protein
LECAAVGVPTIGVSFRTGYAKARWIGATRFNVDNHAACASGPEFVVLNFDEVAIAD